MECNDRLQFSENILKLYDYWPIKAIVDASFDSAYEYISKERIKTNNYELEKAMELAHEYGLTAIRQTDPMLIGWHHYCFYLLT